MSAPGMRSGRAYALFLVLVAAAGVLVAQRYLAAYGTERRVAVTLVQNGGPVTGLDVRRDPRFVIRARVATVDFPLGVELRHRSLGYFPLRRDFFAELAATLVVKQAGWYVFTVVSDDGFRLRLDDNVLGEVTSRQELRESSFAVALEQGTYRYRLDYFQAQGPLALEAFVERQGDGRRHLVGEDSRLVEWRAPEGG